MLAAMACVALDSYPWSGPSDSLLMIDMSAARIARTRSFSPHAHNQSQTSTAHHSSPSEYFFKLFTDMKSLESELEGGLTLNDARMNPNYPLIPQRFISITPIKPPSPKHHLAPPPLPFLPSSTQPIYTTHPPHSHTILDHHYPQPQPQRQ